MGSIGLWREKGQSNADFFAKELGVEVVADATIGGVWYGAIKAPGIDGVFCYVSPIRWYRSAEFGENFIYKMQDETMGPYDAQASAKVLDALDPIDSEYANEWRAKCRANLESKAKAKKVTKGTIVQFAEKMNFTDGVDEDTFVFIERNKFRRVSDGVRVSITSWRSRNDWKTAADEEHTHDSVDELLDCSQCSSLVDALAGAETS